MVLRLARRGEGPGCGGETSEARAGDAGQEAAGGGSEERTHHEVHCVGGAKLGEAPQQRGQLEGLEILTIPRKFQRQRIETRLNLASFLKGVRLNVMK